MHVIGVAEPDGPSPEAEAEAAEARRHLEFENYVGSNLALVSDALVTAGVWGVNGVRQRILVSTSYLHECWARRADTFDRYTRSTPTYPSMGYTIFREADSQYPRI